MRLLLTLILIFPIILFSKQYNRLKLIKKLSFKADSVHALKGYKIEADYLDKIAVNFENLGKLKAVDSILSKTISLCLKHDLKKELAECYNKMGINFTVRGNLDSGIVYFNKSLTEYQKLKEYKFIANGYQNLGVVYSDNGDYSTAMKMQVKALEIREKHKLLEGIPITYMSIGELYGKLDNLEKYKHNLDKAYKLLKIYPAEGRGDEVSILYEFGTYYNSIDNLDSAKNYFNRVVTLAKKIQWSRAVTAGQGELATLYAKTNELDSALVMRKEVYKSEIKLENMIGTLDEIIGISEILIKQKNHTEAIAWLDKGLLKAKKQNYLEQTKDI